MFAKSYRRTLIFVIQEEDDSVADDGTVTIFTPNRQVTIKLRAQPLPEEVTELLEKHTSLIRDYDQALSSRSRKLPESLSKNIGELRKALAKAFAESGWPEETMDQIWSVGPRRCGPNVLLNRIPRFKKTPVFQEGLHCANSARLEEGDVDIAGVESFEQQ
ncbi:hypothetical protein HPB51_013745 [Rhipicephalus microplus]|uniref:Elongation factor-like GTPase 1 domain-containing protein n=1 Tax=Rhipicephalus microplus TaxID=6941 RepID=A0A9J6F4E6_RHIMP|nr:hypothetical protein HPB51_013745 [Rhipicephalus microplus]